MGWTLVQSVVSSLATQTISGSGLLTATANFPSNTQAGSLIVACILTQSSSVTPTYGSLSFSGGGLTWNTRGSWTNIVSGGWKGSGIFSFIGNQASISSATTISISRTANAVGARTDNMQFVLFEFAGVSSAGSYLDGGGFDLNSNSIPNAGPMFASADHELYITAFVGNTGSSGVPTGFTAGPAFTGIAFGGVAYKLDTPNGTSVAWSSGSQVRWAAGGHTVFGAAATAFNEASLTFF